MSKLYKTFSGDTEEELSNAINAAGTGKVTNGNLTALNAEIANIRAMALQNKDDIKNHGDEIQDNSVSLNELTMDKMPRQLDVHTHMYEFLDIDKPAGAIDTEHIQPQYDGTISLYQNDMTVDLVRLSDDAHLYFIWIAGKMYSLPILKYDATSDPVRLDHYVIDAGGIAQTLTFSVMKGNAALEMKVHGNPQDLPTIKLLEFF